MICFIGKAHVPVKMLLLFLIVHSSTSLALKPISITPEIPPTILGQFLDYDLIVHFDNEASLHLDKVFVTKNHDHQATLLINYAEKNRIVKRPPGYKYLNIVHLTNPFNFESFSNTPYNFFQDDIVLIILEEYTSGQIEESQLWKMAGFERSSAIFIYSEGLIFHCCYYCGDATAKINQITVVNFRECLNDYSDFNGHIFKVAYSNYPPFFWCDVEDNCRPQGAEGELLQQFSKVHNFRYDLVHFGDEGGKGAWDDMVEAVRLGEVDWAVGGLSVSIKRGINTDFTRYIKKQGFAVLYSTYQDTWSVFENFLLVFKLSVWICIFCSITCISSIGRITNKRHLEYTKMALRSIVEQPVLHRHIKRLKATLKMVFVIWWLSQLSLTSVYKSQLASTLITPIYKEPNRIDELVEKGFRFQVSSDDWSVLAENLASSSDEVYGKVLESIYDDLSFCQSVTATTLGKVAVIHEEIPIQYQIFKECYGGLTPEAQSKLRLLNQNLFPSTYHAWSMRVASPFRIRFSKTIGRMDDYGLIHQWYKSAAFYRLPRSNERNNGRDAVALTVVQIFPPLLILGLGLGLSICVFLMEILI